MGRHLRKKDKLRKKKGGPKVSKLTQIDPEKNARILEEASRRQAKTHKGRLALKACEPQVHEEAKNALFMRSATAKQEVRSLLRDLSVLRKPHSLSLARKQGLLDPFQNHEPIEYLCKKNVCNVFAYALSSKSKPCRMCFGRVFENELLDMYECNVSDYLPLSAFSRREQPVYGALPLVIAQGADFNVSDDMRYFRNCLLDFFSAAKPQKVLLEGLTTIVTLTAVPDAASPPDGIDGDNTDRNVTVHFRRFLLEKAAVMAPSAEEFRGEEIGPRFALRLVRRVVPDDSTWKAAVMLPRQVKKAKVKNVSTNLFGETFGRIHVGKQELQKLHTPHHHRATTPVTAATAASTG